MLDPAVDHVHGALIHDGVLLLGTHSGLVEVDLTTGRTWERVSLTGEVDFHGLAADGLMVVSAYDLMCGCACRASSFLAGRLVVDRLVSRGVDFDVQTAGDPG